MPAALLVAALALAAAGARAGAATRPVAHATAHPVRRAAAARAHAPAPGAGTTKSARELAGEARQLEDTGAYGRAASDLRLLRARTRPDADLELYLALDEARAGALDSAWTRLTGPRLTAALADTLPAERRRLYAWERDQTWLDGRYTGWPWYIARARAEVAASLGRWQDAHAAAELAVAMHPLDGEQHAMLAVCAAHDGDWAGAREAAMDAVRLDPALPEAHELAGWFDWHDGHRADAAEQFRAAMALDSSDATAALALMRSRLPGAMPDSLPVSWLHGAREAGLLTSPVGPKPEEFEQMETPAIVLRHDLLPLPDSLMHGLKPFHLALPILVDTHGRAALHTLPWTPPDALPGEVVAHIVASVPQWRFKPAERHGEKHDVWAAVEVDYQHP